MRTVKETQQTTCNSAKRRKGDRLGWTPRNEVQQVEVCLMVIGTIVNESECYISAPAQIVQ